MAEILIIPSATSFSSEYWALLPFARGSIHITSSVAGEPAAINPNYYILLHFPLSLDRRLSLD
ncbi:god1, glucose oxidase, partial sequence [Botrytis cinerea T4]|uniref:God1, glucose oxidase, partial sequence n=1 Tax=Botryotinia fuckeliana (strain T4) TaxID=999810 RepID=G2XSG3_BOTF4